jgi:multicomponent Na+:H+ antiporter subunit E
MHSILLFVSLMAFYVVLSGQIGSVFLMSAGVVSCLAVTLLAKRLGIVDDEGMPYRWWLRTTKYVPWLVWQVVLANIDVLKRVWRPKLDIQPQMFTVKHELTTAYGIATYMNSITLTPGTVTVDIGKDELLIHALTTDAAEDLAGGEMHRRVLAIEGRTPGQGDRS